MMVLTVKQSAKRQDNKDSLASKEAIRDDKFNIDIAEVTLPALRATWGIATVAVTVRS